MDQSSDGVVIRESRVMSVTTKVILVTVVIVSALSLGAVWYMKQVQSQDVASELVSYGLEVVPAGDINPSGRLFFSGALSSVDDTAAPKIYSYDWDERKSVPLLDTPAESHTVGNKEFDAAIVYLNNQADPDGYEPAWINKISGEVGPLPSVRGFNETDLVASVDSQYYAYSYRPLGAGDIKDLKQWNVVIYNYATQEKIIIEQAAEPKFIQGSEAVIYMTEAGLVKYTLSTNESVPLYSLYQNLEMYDDFDISSDATKIILTVQRLNLISVAELVPGDNTYQEVGAIRNTSARYRAPVVSPDNQFFAVTAAQTVDFNFETQSYSKINAEIRAVGSSDVIDIVTFDGFIPASVTLEGWAM